MHNSSQYSRQSIRRTIAGLHVTSRRPCWWSRTKAFLSSGNETLFSCKFFEEIFFCFDPQHLSRVTHLSFTTFVTPPCHVVANQDMYAAVTITSTQRHTSLLIGSRRRKLEVHHFEVLILMKIFYPGILRTLLMMQTFSNHFIRVIFVIFCQHFFQIW